MFCIQTEITKRGKLWDNLYSTLQFFAQIRTHRFIFLKQVSISLMVKLAIVVVYNIMLLLH